MKIILLLLLSATALAQNLTVTVPPGCTATPATVAVTCNAPPPSCPPPSQALNPAPPPACVCASGYTGQPPNCTLIPPPSTCTININPPYVYTANLPIPMGPNDTIAMRFVPKTSASSYSRIQCAEWQAPAANRTYTLSTQSCDFGEGVGGYPQTNSTVTANFTVGKTNTWGMPVLTPGTTYYLNIKNTAPVTAGSHQMVCNILP